MLSITPLAVLFVSIFLFKDLLDREPLVFSNWREAFLAAVVAMGAGIALSSEALSLLKMVTQVGVAILWLGVFLLVLALAWKRRILKLNYSLPNKSGEVVGVVDQPILRLTQRIQEKWSWRAGSLVERTLLMVVFVFTTLLFVVARLAPPNTNDSLSYHLSRVMHWIQNQGLMHYATAIDRQLWMPAWAEMAVMQLYLLKGDDGLSNLVQWFSMAACLVVVSLIAGRLGAGAGGQLFAALFCVTLPMGILQATSSQTDYATALWLLALAYYSLLAHQRQLAKLEWVLLSLAVALGILTKGTFYVFALPFLAWLLVSTWRRGGWRVAAKYILLGAILVSGLNAGTWVRNTHTYGYPLGPRQAIAALSNESLSPGILISNLVRNSTLHLGTPYGVINGPARELVDWFHRVIGQDAQDPRTTLDEYRIKRYLHEDRAGNPFHFLLIPLMFLLLLRPYPLEPESKRNTQVLFALLLLSTFLIFSAVYKWQSTGSRLLLPFFVAWAPLAGAAFSRSGLKVAWIAAGVVLVSAGLHPLISNPSRALIPLSPDFAGLFSTPRDQLLFANSPEVMPAYHSIASDIRQSGCLDIGLKIDSSDAEYPFWYLLGAPKTGVRIEHLDVQGSSAGYLPADFHPCAVVCSYCGYENQHGLPLISVYQGTYFLYLMTSPSG